ncbi:hypothetical protein EDD85DRAFT_108223 [Armillaria nabsnona]|nr:hypothetical protein EDD85DRAFT_108223 [Armillaria nabsnona]
MTGSMLCIPLIIRPLFTLGRTFDQRRDATLLFYPKELSMGTEANTGQGQIPECSVPCSQFAILSLSLHVASYSSQWHLYILKVAPLVKRSRKISQPVFCLQIQADEKHRPGLICEAFLSVSRRDSYTAAQVTRLSKLPGYDVPYCSPSSLVSQKPLVPKAILILDRHCWCLRMCPKSLMS